jgi:hypothetical protein
LKPIVIIYNYQTLIAGSLALLGAIWTVSTIKRQIKQAGDQEKERRERKHLVAQAMASDALSQLSNYARSCVKLLSTLLPVEGEQTVTATVNNEVPPIPAGAVLTLGGCLEFGDGPIRKDIADLIRKLQIQHSRLIDIKSWLNDEEKLVVRSNIIDFILDALEVYARCAKLFPYARDQLDNFRVGKLTSGDVSSAAHNCGIWDSSEIFEAIKRRFD